MHRPDIWAGHSCREKMMDVKTVCLGMLTDGDASGYDLKKYFECSFGHFFPAGYGSIYPALATLARNGLVEFEEILQDGKPDRKVYHITEKGREELMRGLSDTNPTHKVRSEFLATLWFANLLSDEQINSILDNKLAELDKHRALIDEFMTVEHGNPGNGARFVAGFGQHMMQAIKQYINDNRGMLTSTTELKSAAR
jgi:DNA-binding PadR family transcriptional regulator